MIKVYVHVDEWYPFLFLRREESDFMAGVSTIEVTEQELMRYEAAVKEIKAVHDLIGERWEIADKALRERKPNAV